MAVGAGEGCGLVVVGVGVVLPRGLAGGGGRVELLGAGLLQLVTVPVVAVPWRLLLLAGLGEAAGQGLARGQRAHVGRLLLLLPGPGVHAADAARCGEIQTVNIVHIVQSYDNLTCSVHLAGVRGLAGGAGAGRGHAAEDGLQLRQVVDALQLEVRERI